MPNGEDSADVELADTEVCDREGFTGSDEELEESGCDALGVLYW
jgi:hypothetical protein